MIARDLILNYKTEFNPKGIEIKLMVNGNEARDFRFYSCYEIIREEWFKEEVQWFCIENGKLVVNVKLDDFWGEEKVE